MKKRSVRLSQVLHPYGPGAVLDLGQESFVMLDTDFNSTSWKKSKIIRLPRLEARLKVGKFRSPPDNSLDKKSSLQVQRFPQWLFCPSCRDMVRWSREHELKLKEKKLEAPECENSNCKGSLLVPMRYVAACKNGHLSDVDWWKLAHSKGRAQCNATDPKLKFISNSGGASLNSLEVKCSKCGANSDLGDLQKSHTSRKIGQRCLGKQPWQSFNDREECNETLKYLLRSETAVHFSDIQSALDLDKSTETEENELQVFINEQLQNEVLSTAPVDIVFGLIRAKITDKFEANYTDEEISDCINSSRNPSNYTPPEADPEREEWKRLCKATSGESKVLKIRETGWRNRSPAKPVEKVIAELVEDVLLVERLREVRAFVSFSRVDPTTSIDSNNIAPNGKRLANDNAFDWLPAIEVFGEGIFFKLSNQALVNWEKKNAACVKDRQKKIKSKLREEENWVKLRYGNLENLLPRFCLVHTLSHALMRQLSFDCGYNLASIREKLFVFEDNAGILLYTAQGDSEGSLGGLVRQGEIDASAQLITKAIERLVWCSNDPICSEMPDNGLEGLNKSACHACAIVPETSCTHLNSFLDRGLVVNSGQDVNGFEGFFNRLFVGE